ncbi:MAG: GxxExxY protein [Ectothiorhodospiraceae bacterium]|nr:GxxExxY protein [Ectothiorhodospiraceae bacterium]
MDENELSSKIIGAGIEVHRTLGPGLLESVYHQCLARELDLQRFVVKSEVPISAEYKGLSFDVVYRADLLVADKVVVELKVVEKLLPVHEAQLLSYLRLMNKKLGLLINFNVPILKDGIRRVVNKL